jgi:hypothetical protein
MKAEDAATKKESIVSAYMGEYSKAMGEAFKLGGYPFAVFSAGIVIVILSLVINTTNPIGEPFPFIIGFAAIIATLGIVIYFQESNWKKRTIEKSFDQFSKYIELAANKFLEKKESMSQADMEQFLKFLSDAIRGITEVKNLPNSLKNIHN